MIRLSESSSIQIAPYAVAIMTPIVAIVAAFLFAPIVRTTLLFFIIAVLFSGWYGGLKPGLICGAVSALLIDYFLLGPDIGFSIAPSDMPLFVLFGFVVFFVSIIEESRIRTEKALRESRDQLRVVIEAVSVGVTAQAADGTVLFSNDAAARLAGFKTAQEMLASPIQRIRTNYEIFDEQGQSLDFDLLPNKRVFKESKPSQITYRWRLQHEDYPRWMNLKSSPILDAQGRVQMAINIFTDITEDKESEVKLRDAHERLETMLASINNGVIATDTEGVIELMNPLAEKLTGWTQAQAIGKTFEDIVSIVSEDNGQRIVNPIRSVLRDGKPIDVLAPGIMRNKDGSGVPIGYNAAPIQDQYGANVGAVMVFRDISERQKAEQERNQLTLLLATQQKRLENILANIPGIVWESKIVPETQTQRMEFVNSYVEKMLGYSRDEWLNTPQFGEKIIHPDDLASSQREAQAIYEGGEMSAAIQFRCIAKNGRVIPVEAHYTILTDETGKTIGTCGLIMDISQRKADENALKQSALDLSRSNEQLEQFAYVASHDLQEPLRMITSYLQLLERRYKNQLDQDASDFIAYAVDGATRMKALINDLLMYSRVKTSEQNFERFESRTALEQAMTNLQIQIKESGAQISYDGLPPIVGNEAQVVQLFQNLLSNSIKFRKDAAPAIEIKAVQNDKMWTFSVHDNGIGIEPQYMERIFVIFQRLHTKDRYPGTGIGLAICKKVVEHHGGRIWAESIPGAGTTFWFTIPSSSWSK
jgi:PAS domain S-box-containing protein